MLYGQVYQKHLERLLVLGSNLPRAEVFRAHSCGARPAVRRYFCSLSLTSLGSV